jgi:hypothetical protein
MIKTELIAGVERSKVMGAAVAEWAVVRCALCWGARERNLSGVELGLLARSWRASRGFSTEARARPRFSPGPLNSSSHCLRVTHPAHFLQCLKPESLIEYSSMRSLRIH